MNASFPHGKVDVLASGMLLRRRMQSIDHCLHPGGSLCVNHYLSSLSLPQSPAPSPFTQIPSAVLFPPLETILLPVQPSPSGLHLSLEDQEQIRGASAF